MLKKVVSLVLFVFHVSAALPADDRPDLSTFLARPHIPQAVVNLAQQAATNIKPSQSAKAKPYIQPQSLDKGALASGIVSLIALALKTRWEDRRDDLKNDLLFHKMSNNLSREGLFLEKEKELEEKISQLDTRIAWSKRLAIGFLAAAASLKAVSWWSGQSEQDDGVLYVPSMDDYDRVAGGRGAGWIKKMFGKKEDEIVRDLADVENPPVYTLGEIRNQYDAKLAGAPRAPREFFPGQITVIKGVGVSGIHRVPVGKNAIVMVASRSHFLDLSGGSLEASRTNRTQGPQAALEMAGAALLRKKAVMEGELPGIFAHVLTAEAKKHENGGFFRLGEVKGDALQDLADKVKKDIDQLRILPQWGITELSGNHQLQLLAAAPSFGAGKQDELHKRITRDLVAAQYEAAAKLAVLRSQETGRLVPLHLTLLGQGVFHNDTSALAAALQVVTDTVKGHNVRLFVHAYSQKDQKKVKAMLDKQAVAFRSLTRKQFRSERLDVTAVPLASYLKEAVIPDEVGALVRTGRTSLSNARKFLHTGLVAGGRRDGWIEQTFGVAEDEIVQQLAKINPPKTNSVDDIAAEYALLRRGVSGRPTIRVVQGVSISDLPKISLSDGECIVQLASQFNYLESPDDKVVPVSAYIHDLTQGPLGAVEYAAATLHRHAAVTAGKLDHMLVDVLPRDAAEGAYRNGYLRLGKLTKEQCDAMVASKGKMRILAQWAQSEASDKTHLVVCSAAPSFQGGSSPAEGSHLAHVCEELVVAQYRALAQLAAIRSQKTGKRVRLHLTRVGQGVFRNPPSIEAAALRSVNETVKGYNVDVYIHAFSPGDKLQADASLASALVER